MVLGGIVFLVVVLLVIHPIVQRRREEELARRLEKTRDPLMAAAMVDSVVGTSDGERRTLKGLREHVWRNLFR